MAQMTLQEVQAMNSTPNAPAGTAEEVQAAGMPLQTVPSCHEPNVLAGIRGCPHWHVCTMSYKGKQVGEGGGPRNHCWERIKSAEDGGAIVRNVQPCFWGVAQQEVVSENKAVLRVIADEGETYETLTSISKPTATDIFNREVEMVKFHVEPFKRLREQKPMAQALMRAEIMQKERERVAVERTAETLGIEGGSTPLDKRGGRGRKGSEA